MKTVLIIPSDGGSRRWISLLATLLLAVFAQVKEGVCVVGTLQHLRTVAYSDQIVDVGFALQVESPFASTINNNGDVAFLSQTSQGRSLWAERDGQLYFRKSPEAEVDNVFYTDSEEVVFSGFTGSFSYNRHEKVWKWTTAGVTQLAGLGFPIVDEDGQPISNFQETYSYLVAVSRSGKFVYDGHGGSPSVSYPEFSGFWVGNGTPGGSQLALGRGDPVPGEPGIIFANTTSYSPPRLNGSDQFVMSATTWDDPFEPNEKTVLVTNRSGQLEVLYKEGEQIPGQPSGVKFSTFDTSFLTASVINDAGDIAFTSSSRLFVDRDGQLDQVARTGDSVLGGLEERTIRNFGLGEIALNHEGVVAIQGMVRAVSSTDDLRAILIQDPNGGMRSVVVDNEPVPGGPAGSYFDLPTAQDFQLNRLGQMALTGYIDLPGTTTDTSGVFAFDFEQGLIPIALPGDLIEVTDGDIRQIARAEMNTPTHLRTSGNEDGAALSFNDRGEILIEVEFTDGTSGVFVSSALVVPEPPGEVLLFTAVLGMLCFPRRPSVAGSFLRAG